MEPNNMNAAGAPNVPNQPVGSAQPTAPMGAEKIEQALAEANMEVASSAGVPMGAPVKKAGKGMLYGMIVFAVLAIAGIGFGVYMMMDGNTQKANLEKQISDLRAQNNQLQEQIAEDDNNENEDNDETSVVDPEDYIYVGEWGVKIKKSKDLSTVSYRYGYGGGYTEVVVWGVDCLSGQCQYFPDFANVDMNSNGLGRIRRYSKGKEFDAGSAPELVFSDDQYDYYFFHIQVAYSADNPENGEEEWEASSIDLVSEMLSNEENYSAI